MNRMWISEQDIIWRIGCSSYNRMYYFVFTIIYCICSFQPTISNISKRALSCKILSGMTRKLQIPSNLSTLQIGPSSMSSLTDWAIFDFTTGAYQHHNPTAHRKQYWGLWTEPFCQHIPNCHDALPCGTLVLRNIKVNCFDAWPCGILVLNTK